MASFWPKEEACPYIDKYMLIAFGVIFVLIHVGLIIWFVYAYKDVRKVKKKEKVYLENLGKNLNSNHTSSNIIQNNLQDDRYSPIKNVINF